MDDLNEKINEAVKEKLFNDTSKCENTINLSNAKHTDKDFEKYKKSVLKLIKATDK